jgi:DNA-binding transcriptional LysR family regulator
VARNGTVSEKTPAHHATVIRRIDRLEKKFPAKLFDRRKPGYVLTSTGHHVTASAGLRQQADRNITGIVRLTGRKPNLGENRKVVVVYHDEVSHRGHFAHLT